MEPIQQLLQSQNCVDVSSLVEGMASHGSEIYILQWEYCVRYRYVEMNRFSFIMLIFSQARFDVGRNFDSKSWNWWKVCNNIRFRRTVVMLLVVWHGGEPIVDTND
jgi:hypothetical protein